MGKNLNTPTQKPQIAGLGPQQVASQEADQPVTYFSGIAPLKVQWIMNPVDQFTRPTPGGANPKGK